MRAADHVRYNITDDGIVILDIDKGEIYSGNWVSAALWKGLLDGKSMLEVVRDIKAETKPGDVSLEVIARDGLAFVQDIIKKGLLADVGDVDFGSAEFSADLKSKLGLVGSSTNVVP
jgi:hypothetical protein